MPSNNQLNELEEYGDEISEDDFDSEGQVNSQLIKYYCRKSSLFDKNNRYMSEDEFEFRKLLPIRAQTAPPRPLTEIEEFRRTSDFLLLENTVMMADHLKLRTDDKYDLDSKDG